MPPNFASITKVGKCLHGVYFTQWRQQSPLIKYVVDNLEAHASRICRWESRHHLPHFCQVLSILDWPKFAYFVQGWFIAPLPTVCSIPTEVKGDVTLLNSPKCMRVNHVTVSDWNKSFERLFMNPKIILNWGLGKSYSQMAFLWFALNVKLKDQSSLSFTGHSTRDYLNCHNEIRFLLVIFCFYSFLYMF